MILMYDLTLTSLLSFLESKSKAAKRRLRKQSAGGGGGGGGVGALFMAAAAIEAAADASPEAGHREKSKKCQKRNADQVASSGSESEGNAAAAAGASDESGSDTNSAADDVQRDEEEEEYEKLEKKDQKKGVVQVATKTPADGVIDVEVEYTFTVTLGFNSANNKASGTALELTPDSPSLKNLPFALGEGISAGDADLVITAGLLGFAKRHPKQAVRKNSNLFGIGVSQTGQIKATVTKAVFDYSETVRWTSTGQGTKMAAFAIEMWDEGKGRKPAPESWTPTGFRPTFGPFYRRPDADAGSNMNTSRNSGIGSSSGASIHNGDDRGSSYCGNYPSEGSGHESDYGGHGGVGTDDDDDDETSYKYQHGMVFAIVQKHFPNVGLVWNQSSGDFVIGQLKSRGGWDETISSGTPTWWPPANDKSMGGWPAASKPKKMRELHPTGETAEAGGAAAAGADAADAAAEAAAAAAGAAAGPPHGYFGGPYQQLPYGYPPTSPTLRPHSAHFNHTHSTGREHFASRKRGGNNDM